MDLCKFLLLTILKEKLYVNMKECSFLHERLLFSNFIVFAEGNCVDEDKVRSICEWSTPKK